MNPLQQLQEDVTTLCLGNPDTAVVPFTSFRKEVIESADAEAKAAWNVRAPDKIGIACLVLMPSLRSIDPNVPGPQYEVEIIIRTFSDPRVNNTGLSAEDVAMANLRWLDGQIIEGLVSLRADEKKDSARPVYDFPGLLVYDSTLISPLPQDKPARSITPTIADDDAGTVTLTAYDPKDAIYFTTDGTMPLIGNAAQLYAAPFKVNSNTIIRWLAWQANQLASYIGQATVKYP